MSVELLDDNFNFDELVLMPPTGVQGGAYFSRLKYKGEKLMIQTQKCRTKNGIKKTGKKSYCDLMFVNEENDFLLWAEQFEDKIKELIFDNKDNWFHDDLEKDDIDYNWNSSIRSYKSKYYLFRTFIERSKITSSEPKLQIFNEDQERLTVNDITSDSNMICIIEIKGLKFTSQSFHLECSLVQIMLINDNLIENQCLIKIDNKKTLEKSSNVESLEDSMEEVSDKKDNIENKEINNLEEDEATENANDNPKDIVNEKNSIVEESDNVLPEMTESEEVTENTENIKNTEVKEDNEPINDLENNEILEVNLELPKDLEEINTLKLKKPNEVYIDMYEQTLKKAKLAKRLAIEAYLEAKEIKRTYMLDLEEYMDDDLEKIINSSNINEIEKIK
tara:strand:- start:27 stop:1199 length:1173 start_codon:yes stop_codon:yes gene_type:complete